MGSEDARRICETMKFPSMLSMEEYRELLVKNGFEVIHTADLTHTMAEHIENYLGQLPASATSTPCSCSAGTTMFSTSLAASSAS